MKVIIDRFEEDYAIVETENKEMIEMHISLIPGAKEGDVININIDVEETEKRNEYIRDLMEGLWED